MKRLCTALLALALVLSLAPMALAADATPDGSIYLYEDGSYTRIPDDLTPGKTYYIKLGASSSGDKPTRASTNLLCTRIDNDKKISLTSSSLDIVKKKLDGSNYFYCVELKLKDIPLSAMSVDEHQFHLSGTIDPNKVYSKFDISCDVAYAVAGNGDEIERTPQLFMFDDEDVSINLPGSYGRIEFTTKNQVKTLLAMDTDYNQTIANKYPNANIDFLNGNGASIGKTATMYIESDSKYLYELKNGKLTDLSSKYNNNEDAFVIKTSTLDTYLLSSSKLSGSALPPAGNTPGNTTPPTGGSGSGSGSTGASGSTLASVIKNNFSNEFRVINYGDSYKAIANVQLKVAGLDISNLNKSTLMVYAYDQANNRLIPLNAKAKVGNDGALYFYTNAQGYYVITDSALKAK